MPSGTFGVLAAIENFTSSSGCHGKDLAAACALDPSTISRAVAALVRAGLVVRTADPEDGRASRLAMTASGRQALDEVDRWSDRLLSDALRDWTVEDLNTLAGLLQRFSTDLMTRVDDHPWRPRDERPDHHPC